MLSPVFLFLLACHNNPAESNEVSKSNTSIDSSDAFIRKWTEKMAAAAPGDTVNFTDANNLKQGHWVTFENDKIVKQEWYKDGKLIDDPKPH